MEGSSPIDVNSSGNMSGAWDDAAGVQHGYYLSHGVYTGFDPPGSVYNNVGGMNDQNVIVGDYCTTQDCVATGVGAQWYSWSNGVFTYLTPPWPTATTATQPEDINNAGTLLGNYIDQAGYVHSFTWTL